MVAGLRSSSAINRHCSQNRLKRVINADFGWTACVIFVRQTGNEQTQSFPSIHSVRKKADGTFELIGFDTHNILFAVLQSSQVPTRFQAVIGAKW